MKIPVSLFTTPFKILIRTPRFIINAVKPFKQIYKKANTYYEEYHKFMCTSGMPEFGLIYHRFNPIDRATEDFGSCGCDMYILNLNNGAYKKKLKATLFHEFTHIYDDEWLKNEYHLSNAWIDKKKKWAYKEIHAEQIKTLFLLGAKTKNDIPQITHNQIMYMGKNITFYEYCLREKKTLISIIDYFKTLKKSGRFKMSERNCWQYVDCIMYYIGIVSIYKKCCTYDIDNLMDLSYIADYLGDGINRLLDIYCTCDIGDVPKEIIIESGNIRMSIINFIKNELRIVK